MNRVLSIVAVAVVMAACGKKVEVPEQKEEKVVAIYQSFGTIFYHIRQECLNGVVYYVTLQGSTVSTVRGDDGDGKPLRCETK